MRFRTSFFVFILISSMVSFSESGAAGQCRSVFHLKNISLSNQFKIVETYQARGNLVNMFLRTGDNKYSQFMSTEDIKKFVKSLDQMIAQSDFKQDIILYRGETHLDIKAIPKVGEIVLRKNYVSTTDSMQVAEVFSSGIVNIILRIHLSQGQKALPLNALISAEHRKDEREVLLPRDSQFTVTNVQKQPTYWLIDVDVL